MSIGNYRFDAALAADILQNIGLVLVILVITWLLAQAAKWAFAKLVDNVSFLQSHTSGNGTLGTQLGKIVSLLIWLFGLLAVLQIFDLGGVMQPVTTLLDSIMGFVPQLIGAGLIFFIGLMVARILRDLTVTALQTVNFDKWANKGGVDSVTGNATISKTIGVIVYVLVILPVAIMALETLNLESISVPASEMLQLIFDAIPRIIGAAILLGLGYLISRFVVDILDQLLSGFGVDRSLSESGLLPEGARASSIIARVAQVAIILFFAIAATRLLAFPELTAILNEVLLLGGRVVFGAVVIGFGFLLANLLERVLSGTSGPAAGQIAKWAAIVLFSFMGLSYTGVGEIITETAFTALVVGASVAGALAFGLGGREWAARKLDQLDKRVMDSKEGASASATTINPASAEDPQD